MRVLIVVAILLAGCTTPFQGVGGAECPGHWHFTVFLMGDGEITFFSESDMDARAPVAGIHMHGDDNLVHAHPAQQTCFSWADGLEAVGVVADAEGITVDGVRYDGQVEVDVRPWGGDWASYGHGALANRVQDAAQLIVLVGATDETRAEARATAPEIPNNYQPQ